MTLNRTIRKRLLLVLILALWAVAVATAQGGIVVYEGDSGTYKVNNHAGSLYSWAIYSEPTLKTKASDGELKIVSGNSNSTLVVKWLKAGTYFATVEEVDRFGCTNTKAIAVQVNPVITDKPTARIAGASQIALGGCNARGYVIDASGSSGAALSFTWSPTAYLDNATSAKPLFTPGKTTRYHLTLTDGKGQKDTASVLITVANLPKAVTDKNVFVSSVATSIMLDGGKSTGSGITYLWQSTDGVILSQGASPVAEVRGIGKYYLKITDSFGCTSLDSVDVELYTQAVKDTGSTRLNFSVDINVLANDIPKGKLNPATLRIISGPKNGMASLVGDSLVSYIPNPYFAGSDSFTYSICDYFQHCDQATVLVLVNDLPFFIPQAFSPNGDGINDEFVINGLAKYKTVEITIFNRWGNVVYQSANYGEGQGKTGWWNGVASQGLRFGTGPVPTGTYFYILTLDGKEKLNGAIYLDR